MPSQTPSLASLLALAAVAFAAPALAQAPSTPRPAAPAAATPCEVRISGNDALQFDLKTITVSKKACPQFRVVLRHSGKLPKAAMGHNWVLTRTADVDAVAKDGVAAGLANEYVKPRDPRVIAASRLVGGGETTTVTVPTARLDVGGDYMYVCTFPGHYAVMRGKFVVTP